MGIAHIPDLHSLADWCTDSRTVKADGNTSEVPKRGITLPGGWLALWYCTWIESEVKRIKSLGNQSPPQRHPALLYKSAGARVVWHHVNQSQPSTTGLPLKQERHRQPADELGVGSAPLHPTLSYWMTSSSGDITFHKGVTFTDWPHHWSH
jgi:hypothetical protein